MSEPLPQPESPLPSGDHVQAHTLPVGHLHPPSQRSQPMVADRTLVELPFFPYGDCRLAGHALPPKPEDVCEACWDGPFGAYAPWLFDFSDGNWQETKSYSYWTSGEERAKNGGACIWCRVLSSTQRDFHRRMELEVEVRLHFDNGAPAAGIHAITFTYGTKIRERSLYTFNEGAIEDKYVYIVGVSARAKTVLDQPPKWYIRKRDPIVRNAGDKRTLALAHGLFETCQSDHKHCRLIATPPEETLLPTLLINCTDPKHPRLIRTTVGQCGAYVALSYVWGEDQRCKTTRSTMAKYEDGGIRLQVSLLPKTIRQAIRVTHQLGFERLWVDSLCIVQDEREEMLHELKNMHNIYRYATLTIVASCARGAEEGFLRDLPRPPLKPASRPVLCPPTQSVAAPRVGTLNLFPDVQQGNITTGRPIWSFTEPINKRAWCLQEQLLSPRSLLFTSESLRFRCQTATYIVRTEDHALTPSSRPDCLPDAVLCKPPSPLEHGSPQWGTLHHAWLDVVTDYSARTMSRESDKLVACAAIAEAFQRVFNSEYLAGLWRHSLLTDLIWHTSPQPSTDPEALPRAPSWSWAALEGKIMPLQQRCPHPLAVAEVVQCQVSLKDPSLPFGEVTGGSLVLRVHPLRLRSRLHPSGEHYYWEMLRFDPGQLPSVQDVGVGDEEGAVVDPSIRPWINAAWSPSFDDIDNAADAQWSSTSLLAIPLGMYLGRLGGLIIEQGQITSPPSAGNKRVYRRIGAFINFGCGSSVENEWLKLKMKEPPLELIEII